MTGTGPIGSESSGGYGNSRGGGGPSQVEQRYGQRGSGFGNSRGGMGNQRGGGSAGPMGGSGPMGNQRGGSGPMSGNFGNQRDGNGPMGAATSMEQQFGSQYVSRQGGNSWYDCAGDRPDWRVRQRSKAVLQQSYDYNAGMYQGKESNGDWLNRLRSQTGGAYGSGGDRYGGSDSRVAHSCAALSVATQGRWPASAGGGGGGGGGVGGGASAAAGAAGGVLGLAVLALPRAPAERRDLYRRNATAPPAASTKRAAAAGLGDGVAAASAGIPRNACRVPLASVIASR